MKQKPLSLLGLARRLSFSFASCIATFRPLHYLGRHQAMVSIGYESIYYRLIKTTSMAIHQYSGSTIRFAFSLFLSPFYDVLYVNDSFLIVTVSFGFSEYPGPFSCRYLHGDPPCSECSSVPNKNSRRSDHKCTSR